MADADPPVDPAVDAGEPEEADPPAEPVDPAVLAADDAAADAAAAEGAPADEPADEEPPPEPPADEDEPEAPAAAPAEVPPAVITPPPEPVPVAAVAEVPQPVQRTFTTPSGQTVSVVEHPDQAAAVQEVQTLPVVEEVKPAPVVEEAKPAPVEETPLAPIVAAPVAAVVVQKVATPAPEPAPIPAVIKRATTVSTPATIIEEPAQIEPAPATVADATENVSASKMEKLRAKLDEQKALRGSGSILDLRANVGKIVAAATAINNVKHPPVVIPANLDRPIGIFKEYIAGADLGLNVQQHVYSVSGDDFTIFDEAGKKKIFRTWGKVISASGRMHMLESTSGKALCDMRKKHFTVLSSWYTTAAGRNQLVIKSQMSLGTRILRIRFNNFVDNKPVDLYLKGHFGATKGALLHLGLNESGPVVARIDRDVMNARQILHGKQTYRLRVMKGFDYAVACLICVAFEDRSMSSIQTLLMKK